MYVGAGGKKISDGDGSTYAMASEDKVLEPDVWVSLAVPTHIVRGISRSQHDG